MLQTSDELIDIVNDKDIVIGQDFKVNVHAKSRVLHREIGVLICDEKGRFLLQQRSFKKKFFPGTWSVSAVGHVPAGMTPEEAAHKELFEELGFDTELQFIEKRVYDSGEHCSFGYFYKGLCSSEVKIKLDPNEVEQAKFVTKEELHQMMHCGIVDYHTVETINKFG